eukprot:m.360330 g.360330  ORF g.360330 m.360330 type:complete len:487 (-) comp16639_c0_seq4:160-1620(-)
MALLFARANVRQLCASIGGGFPFRLAAVGEQCGGPRLAGKAGARRSTDAASVRPVGVFTPELPKSTPYPPGTYFLHKRLGYVGIVVLAWEPRVWKYKGPALDTWSSATQISRSRDGVGGEGGAPWSLVSPVKPGVRAGVREAADRSHRGSGAGEGAGCSEDRAHGVPEGEQGSVEGRPWVADGRQPLGVITGVELEASAHAGRGTVGEQYYQVLCDTSDADCDPTARLRLAMQSFVHCVTDGTAEQLLEHGVDYCAHGDIVAFEPTPTTEVVFAHRFKKMLFKGRFDAWGWPQPRRGEAETEEGDREPDSPEGGMDPLRVWSTSCAAGLQATEVFTRKCHRAQVEVRLLSFHTTKIKKLYVTPDPADAQKTILIPRPEGVVTDGRERLTSWSYKLTATHHGLGRLRLIQQCSVVLLEDGAVHKVLVDRVDDHGAATLGPLTPTLQYTRFVTLPRDRGWMGGHLLFEKENGGTIEVLLPTMRLRPHA